MEDTSNFNLDWCWKRGDKVLTKQVWNIYKYQMKQSLRSKYTISIIVVFIFLIVAITVTGLKTLNIFLFKQTRERIRKNINSAWLILNQRKEYVETILKTFNFKISGKTSILNIKQRLIEIAPQMNVDILNIYDRRGRVIFRVFNPFVLNDRPDDALVKKAINMEIPVSGFALFPPSRLKKEGERIVNKCTINDKLIEGMFMGTALPIFDTTGNLKYVIEAGIILNKMYEIVDKITETVFVYKIYKGKRVGTATIFLKDLRISTSVLYKGGQRAIGTRVSRVVAHSVLTNGIPWTGRAWVVNDWYITRYDPIKDVNGKIIGMLYIGELEKPYKDLKIQTLSIYLVIILIGLIAAFVIIYSITGKIIGQVEELSKATKKLAQGDLSFRVKVRTQDELGTLAQSFNKMAEEIERDRNTIERINRNYLDMLGFVSHELKNPLASAILNAYSLKDGYLGELTTAQKKAIESIVRSLDYFEDMIKNYLDLARIEKGELHVKLSENVDVGKDVIQPVIEDLERQAKNKNMIIENRVKDVKITCDPNLLRIVYDNLVSNAIKYGKEGGRIILDYEIGEKEIKFSVYNEGKGIPPDRINHLFKKFQRFDVEESTGRKGTGLGLFIVKEIIEKHNGKVWAESKYGEWAKFIFTIPKDGGE